MPTDDDYGSTTPVGSFTRRKPLPGEPPLETPEQIAARQAREATIQGVGGPQASSNLAQSRTNNFRDQASVDQNVASGNWLPGQYAGQHDKPDAIHPEMSKDQAAAARQRAFGLGEGNNAATAAMLGNAAATGQKFSTAFGGMAGTAAANSAAAGARGLGGFQGDTSSYQQGLANAAQSRGMQTGAYGQLMNFANQGPGPSAAQAQLTQATDANTQNQLALARSGRGMGGSAAAMRQAIGQGATAQQQAAGQMAELRANENTAYQQQRLAAMGQAGDVAYKTAAADQAYGQLGLQGAQYQTDTALKGTQLNDASSQAWAAQQQAALNQAMGAEVGAQTQQLNVNATALTGRENEYASANQTYAAEKGFAQQAAIADANRQQAYVGAGLSAGAGVLSGLASVSDERSKQNITPLGSYRDNGLGSFGGASVPTQAPGAPLAGNDVKPLPSQSGGGTVTSAPAIKMGPTPGELEEQKKDARGQMIGGAAGKVAGGAAGSAIAGPIGGFIGSALGGIAGKALGKVFSDVRNKENIQPLSGRVEMGERGTDSASPEWIRNPNNPSEYISPFANISRASRSTDRTDRGPVSPPWQSETTGGGLGPNGEYLRGDYAKGRRKLDTDAFDALNALAEKHGASGIAAKPGDVEKYAQEPPAARAGSAVGSVAGNIVGGPIGGVVGSALGGIAGKALGKAGDYLQHLPSSSSAPAAAKPAATQTAKKRASASDTPILSAGDALLADSARNAPPAAYDYKNPSEPGAKPGRQVGPMAQDLAAHPVTAGAVDVNPETGRLMVDGARAATVGLAQNHSQQNQLDDLRNEISKLSSLLPRQLSKGKATTSFRPRQSFGGL